MPIHEHDIEYAEDFQNYREILERYMNMNETDGAAAYDLMIDALTLYERFSFVKLQVRREEIKGQSDTRDPAMKDRLDEVLKVLREINQEARMVWRQAEDDESDPTYKHV
jgi:type II secretory pathway component PulL